MADETLALGEGFLLKAFGLLEEDVEWKDWLRGAEEVFVGTVVVVRVSVTPD